MSACPWCRERLKPLAKDTKCPTCGKELVDQSGQPLRAIDLDYEAILRDADERSLLWTKRGAIWGFSLAGIGLVSTFVFPPLTVLVVFVLIVSQFVWTRFFVLRPYVRHFSPLRRLTTRWISRLSLVLFVAPLHGGALVPGLGLLTTPAIFGGTCWLLRAYHRVHFVREHRREGMMVLEIVFLVVLALAFVCMLGLSYLFLETVLSWLPESVRTAAK